MPLYLQLKCNKLLNRIYHLKCDMRANDPPCLNAAIRQMQPRIKAFRRAKCTYTTQTTGEIRKLRALVITGMRNSKHFYYECLATKLEQLFFSSKRWKILKF